LLRAFSLATGKWHKCFGTSAAAVDAITGISDVIYGVNITVLVADIADVITWLTTVTGGLFV
jgi:heme A synthase